MNKMILVNVATLILLAVAGSLPASASGAIVGDAKAGDQSKTTMPPAIVMPPEKTFEQKNKTSRIQVKKFYTPDVKLKVVDPPLIKP